MRSLLFSTLLVLSTLTSCERTEYSTENTGTYDAHNRIFRVKVGTDSNTPYTVNIKRGTEINGTVQIVNNIEVNQKTGIAFDYGFTPGVGETVTVIVKSSRNNIKPFAFYKGTHAFPLEMKQSADGYTAEFSYQVEE